MLAFPCQMLFASHGSWWVYHVLWFLPGVLLPCWALSIGYTVYWMTSSSGTNKEVTACDRLIDIQGNYILSWNPAVCQQQFATSLLESGVWDPWDVNKNFIRMSKILRAKQAPPTGAIRSPGSGGSLFSWNAMFETFRDIDIVDFGVSRSLLAVCAQCSLSPFAGRKDAMSAVHSLHCGKATSVTSDWRARSRLYFDMWTRIDTSWTYTGPECDYPRLFQTLSIVVEMLQVVTIWSV